MARRQPLRLAAQDADDLQIVSAALQDAIAQLGDFRFDRKARRFTAVFNRFRWEDGSKGQAWRTRTALDVSDVLAVQSKRLKQDAPGAVVSLLSVTFNADEAPSGTLEFAFSGGGELRLKVECLDVLMVDIAEPWPAKGRPEHKDDR